MDKISKYLIILTCLALIRIKIIICIFFYLLLTFNSLTYYSQNSLLNIFYKSSIVHFFHFLTLSTSHNQIYVLPKFHLLIQNGNHYLYIEPHTNQPSTFQAPYQSRQTLISLIDPNPNFRELYFTQNVSIPDKIIMASCLPEQPALKIDNTHKEDPKQVIKCCFLFGYQLQLKDWQHLRKVYSLQGYQVKLYKGNQVTQLSESILTAKSFIRGQKNIQQPHKSLIKRDEKMVESSAYMYLVELISQDANEPNKLLFYLPSCFNKNSPDYPLECIKARYFNHKMLQILNEYVSLDNNNASCYKDIAHHEFQAVVYSGKAVSFQIFIKLTNKQSDFEVSESFIEKLSQISMTDKHLLDEVDPLDFSEIKKQIRNYYLEQKRIRKGLTLEKLAIVQQIENILQFLNLKQTYPQKLNYTSISGQMLKKIRSQNIENKANWIKQQNIITRNLQARLIDLHRTKQKYQQALLDQQKSNNQQIQQIRNEIRTLQANIRYEQSQKVNQAFNQNLRIGTENHKRLDSQASGISKNTESTNGNLKGSNAVKKKGSSGDISRQKQQLQQLQKQKILRFEMIKAEFEMQKQFVRRKNEYAKAAEDLSNYLIDC